MFTFSWMNPWTWTREFILVERCSNLRVKTEKAFRFELVSQLNLLSTAILLMNGTQALRCCYTPMNASGMNPIVRGCSFSKYGWTASDCDDRVWTPEWRWVFISVGTLFTINHLQTTAFHWISDSAEMAETPEHESHWMWEFVPATECVA